jgi:hypothetical protein
LNLKKHHSALLVAYLDQPNCASRALIGAFSGPTAAIQMVLTVPGFEGYLIPHGFKEESL